MTREELVDKFVNNLPGIQSLSKYEILKNIQTQNNIECEIGNPNWFILSTSRLRKMISKISFDLNLSRAEIHNLDRNYILEILFSLDTVFRCYKYSLQHQISSKTQLMLEPEIQKKYIYLGATMNKDFSYYLTLLENNQQDRSLCIFIESKYFGKYADIHDLLKYATAFEHFINENKYEQLLKDVRQRQLLQEQELHELRRLLDENVPDQTPVSFLKSVKTRSASVLGRFRKLFTNERRNSAEEGLTIDAACPVCYSNKKTVLYLNCSHISACVDCSERVGNKCPLCRKLSANKLIVYY